MQPQAFDGACVRVRLRRLLHTWGHAHAHCMHAHMLARPPSRTHTHPLSPRPTHPRARAHTRAWRIALCIRCHRAGGRDRLATASRCSGTVALHWRGSRSTPKTRSGPGHSLGTRSSPPHLMAAARLPLGSACGGSRFAVIRCDSLQLKVCRLGGVEAVVLAMHMHTGDRL
jgi:hypothetical protein